MARDDWEYVSTALRIYAGQQLLKWREYQHRHPEALSGDCMRSRLAEIAMTIRNAADKIDEELNK